MAYMEDMQIFLFNETSFQAIISDSNAASNVKDAAKFLKKYLQSLAKDPEEQNGYNVVLLDRSLNLTLKLDPSNILIAFPKRNIPKRYGNMNYASYGEMTGISLQNKNVKKYFYLCRHGGLGIRQLEKLCSQLSRIL